MDKTVPAGAALLLEFVYITETSKAPPDCYEVIFGHRQKALRTPLTQMTIAEVLNRQRRWSTKAWAAKFGSKDASSATGAPQFMRKTLLGLVKELRLSTSLIFDRNLQDRLAYHLLKRRGYEEFIAGRISRTEFGRKLAQEWASFPVLAPTKGAHRNLTRGQSYYEGNARKRRWLSPRWSRRCLTR